MNRKHAYYFGFSALMAFALCDANAAHVYDSWQDRYAEHNQYLRQLNPPLEELVRDMDKLSCEIKELLPKKKDSKNTNPQAPGKKQ